LKIEEQKKKARKHAELGRKPEEDVKTKEKSHKERICSGEAGSVGRENYTALACLNSSCMHENISPFFFLCYRENHREENGCYGSVMIVVQVRVCAPSVFDQGGRYRKHADLITVNSKNKAKPTKQHTFCNFISKSSASKTKDKQGRTHIFSMQKKRKQVEAAII